jgi:alpha-L-rhamnosidase
LSEGWWSGNITYSGNHWNFFGDRQSLLAKIIITYADGSEQVVDSNPTLGNSIPMDLLDMVRFSKEVYDATKEADIQGWTLSNYDDKSWKKAVEVPLEGNAIWELLVMLLVKNLLLITRFQINWTDW